MPPKGWRKTPEGFQPTNSAGQSIKDRVVHGIDDLLLPRSVVMGIAKQALPEGTPIPRDGVTALVRSATMFVSYITSEANLIARNEVRRTVTHNDILKALEKCDFGSFVSPTLDLVEKRAKNAQQQPDNEEEQLVEDVEPKIVTQTVQMQAKRMRTGTEVVESIVDFSAQGGQGAQPAPGTPPAGAQSPNTSQGPSVQ